MSRKLQVGCTLGQAMPELVCPSLHENPIRARHLRARAWHRSWSSSTSKIQAAHLYPTWIYLMQIYKYDITYINKIYYNKTRQKEGINGLNTDSSTGRSQADWLSPGVNDLSRTMVVHTMEALCYLLIRWNLNVMIPNKAAVFPSNSILERTE